MRLNKQITLTTGTPVNILTGLTTAPGLSYPPYMLESLMMQMKHGGTHLGFVMSGVPIDTVASASNADHLSGELWAATADSPGGVWSYMPTKKNFDMRGIWVGGTTGEVVIITYETAGS